MVSGKDRPWSVPLKYLLMFGNFNIRLGLKALPESVVRRFMEKFESDDPIDLEDVAMAAIIGAFDSKYDGKILLGDEMRRVAKSCIEKME